MFIRNIDCILALYSSSIEVDYNNLIFIEKNLDTSALFCKLSMVNEEELNQL